jgi:hypothetical protein
MIKTKDSLLVKRASTKKHIVSAKSLANLRPAKKGEVRNPKGISGPYKGGSRIAWQLKQFMQYQCPEEIKKRLKEKFPDLNVKEMMSGEAIWLGTIVDAIYGDEAAREFVAQRTEGKVPQVIKYDDSEEPSKYTDEEMAVMADALDKIRGDGHGTR